MYPRGAEIAAPSAEFDARLDDATDENLSELLIEMLSASMDQNR